MGKKLNNCVYGFGGAAFGISGLAFIVLGLGCLLLSAVAFVLGFKKKDKSSI